MAGAHLSLRFDHREFLDLQGHLEDLIQDPSLMFMDMGEELLITHRDRLTRGITPSGEPFERLNPVYRSVKPKNKDKVLIRDLYLFNSLNYQLDADGLELGTPLIYGASHQFGDPDRGLPKREYIGLSDSDGEALREIAVDHLRGR